MPNIGLRKCCLNEFKRGSHIMFMAIIKYIIIFGGLTALNWIVFNSSLDGDMNWFRFLLCVYPLVLGLFILPLLIDDDNKKG